MGRGYNHKPWCTCGWCSSSGRGNRHTCTSVVSSAGSIQESVYERFGISPIVPTYESYTIPNARCPVCGALVFFYQSANGGRVFFDALGPPWPKHPCTSKESSKRIYNPKAVAAIQPVEEKRVFSWVDEGWYPFNIQESYKDKGWYKIFGTLHGENLSFYVCKRKKDPMLARGELHKYLGLIREVRVGVWELNVFGYRQETFTVAQRMDDARQIWDEVIRKKQGKIQNAVEKQEPKKKLKFKKRKPSKPNLRKQRLVKRLASDFSQVNAICHNCNAFYAVKISSSEKRGILTVVRNYLRGGCSQCGCTQFKVKGLVAEGGGLSIDVTVSSYRDVF